jgi:hypothetical protein
MIITGIKSIQSLPQPALGFLPAVHDVDIDDIEIVSDEALRPAVETRGMVFKNASPKRIGLPGYGAWPALLVAPGDLFASDGRLYYPVLHKAGTVSYYPKAFERNIYSFTFNDKSLSVGGTFQLQRTIDTRLISNNTSAVCSVIYEIGVRKDQDTPIIEYTIPCKLSMGSREVEVSENINNLFVRMRVLGQGIQDGVNAETYIHSVDVLSGKIILTRTAALSGDFLISFKSPVGPNLGEIEWLPPLLEAQIHLTDILSTNTFSVDLAFDKEITSLTNPLGYRAVVTAYDRSWNAPWEALPTRTSFILRMRLGQFDTENNISDPKGFLAYMVRNPKAELS